MSGNPRKFSEKIAIHQRKLNEEQNAFDSIIAEVTSITRSVEPMAMYAGQWGLGPSTGFFAPGVAVGPEVASGQPRMPMVHSRERSPGAGGGGGHGHAHHSHTYHPYRAISPQHVSPGAALPTRQQSAQRPQMTPPYPGAHMYLVPPQDTSWRRTHSDPGIHASVMHPTIPGVQPNARPIPSHTPPQNNVSPCGSPVGDKQGSSGYFLEPKVSAPQYRPRSCDNVPNISIHPSEPVAGPQVPISNNTGSLPDLPSSLLPAHVQLQQLEGLISGQPPPYLQAIGAASGGGGSGGGMQPSVGPHQQRHSIQLPVQYTQGLFGDGNGGPKYVAYGAPGAQTLGSQGYTHSPYYQPESPRSAPNSPNDGGGGGGSGDSPISSPQAQAQSPGSPYYSLHTQMQNINIDSQEPSVVSSPQNTYFGVGASYQLNSVPPSSAYQQHSIPAQQISGSQEQYRQQMYQALLLRHQVPGQFRQSAMPAGHLQQPLASPSSGQIPDIIFTGADGSISAGVAVPNLNAIAGFMDPTVEILSSDLRVSLDPVDLESLHGLNSEQGLNIDAASEDELRRDRV